MTAVAVVGAGLTGLTAAHALASRGLAVTVYEASGRAGGAVRTERVAGFLIELGPTSFARLAAGPAGLVGALGLGAELVQASALARHRYIVRGGRLVALPMSPPALLTSPALSLAGKLRLLREPFVPRVADDREETVADFARRRFGTEVLDYLVDPFVAGSSAGDPERLGLRAAFPTLARLEAEHGSVLRGALARAGGGGARTLWSFHDGLGELVDALVGELGASGGTLRLRAAVTAIRRAGDGWSVGTVSGDDRYDAVVYAAPAHAVARIALPSELGPLAALSAVEHPPVSVVALGFRRADVTHPLDGFGVLVPAVERMGILGAIFSSTLFPNRAPDDHVLLTAFIGGARDPAAALLGEDAVVERALVDLRRLVGARGAPVLARIGRWPQAIPQYGVAHGSLRAGLDRLERDAPGFFTAGTYRDGIAVGDAIASGLAAAERVLRATTA